MESELSEDEEGDDREVYDVDICPEGCSIVLYERVCAEREERVDIEEIIASERAIRDALIKDLEAGKKRAKIVIDLVEEVQEALEDFQVGLSASYMSEGYGSKTVAAGRKQGACAPGRQQRGAPKGGCGNYGDTKYTNL